MISQTDSNSQASSKSGRKDKRYVAISIDVEGVHGRNPFGQMAYGDIGEEEDWGALKIARVLKENGLCGTFFVDVYEAFLYGEETVGTLCKKLVELEQDVQLHTHPSWRIDNRDFHELQELKREKCWFPVSQDFMYKLSLPEQEEVIKWGCEFLEKWVGKRPVAHRSGGYGANRETLIALKNNGLQLDSSTFYGHPNCKLQVTDNQPLVLDGVVEIPVTGFRKKEVVDLWIGRKTREFPFVKTSIDGVSAREMVWFLDQSVDSGVRVLNVFLHSYSLMTFDGNFKKFSSSYKKEYEFRKILKYILEHDDVVCAPFGDVDIWRKIAQKGSKTKDVPYLESSVSLIHKIKNRYFNS
ncbi:hypothetical protein [Marinobacter salarius]|uniref:hypothetical protein n=1 Tax=Marinobacter salarius TaxID=1420917 RepID=UPI0025A41A18|nr:hypothetical protein [Marinobacter salarius]MDM8179067.1 hypothetical protein [Marinobacter salarius]